MSSFKSLTRFAAIGLAVAAGLVAMAPGLAVAQTNGSWITNGGGSWPTTDNWDGGSVADGTGASGTFSQDIPLAGSYTVTLDGNRTIGNLTFTDTVLSSSNGVWVVSPGTGGTLTLAVSTGTSTINTTNIAANISAVVAGSGGIVKAGAGTLFLSGANTYTGVTRVTAATLEVTTANALGATGSGNGTVVSSGGSSRLRIGADITVDEAVEINGNGSTGALNFGSSQPGVSVSTATMGGLVTLGANAEIGAGTGNAGILQRTGGGDSVNTNGFRLTFTGGGQVSVNSPIGGTGSMRHNGSGTVILAAANTYSGTTAVTGNGTLRLGNGGTGGSLATNSAISLAAALSTFVVDQSDTVTQGVDFSGAAITASAGGLGIGNFTQAGSGTTILNAANSYTGATSVNAGTLLINGNQSAANGAVTVAAGATLGGLGTTGGAVTVNGFLAPGTSPGVLTVSTLTLASTATSLFEINGTTRGTGYDGMNINTASGLTYDGALSLSFGNGSAFADDTTFDLFNFTGTPSGNFSSVTSTGFYAGTWTLASGTWSLNTGEQKLSFTPSTGDLVVAVPEPSTLVLLSGLAAVGCLVRRRRAT
jgi:autotransporter-associated beta strand protein